MADRYLNPFQAIDIYVPVEFHEAFTRYCQTKGNAVIDQSPFPGSGTTRGVSTR